MNVKVTQSCPTLQPHGLYCIVCGILQDRILEWVAFPFSRGSFQPMNPALHMDSLLAEPQGKPKNTGADFPYPVIEPGSPVLQADSLQTELYG